jgi:hypothetical protein|tara:strand:+ start:395 stop:640 length:246 start_codon:yes stop_codon:yes gene_type:complete
MAKHLATHCANGAKVKVGDLVRLPYGICSYWQLQSQIALLIEKMPRNDRLEYDWKVFVDGKYIELGRQIEQGTTEVLSESR